MSKLNELLYKPLKGSGSLSSAQISAIDTLIANYMKGGNQFIGNVSITGGNIDGTSIGESDPADGSFTTLAASATTSGTLTVTGTTASTSPTTGTLKLVGGIGINNATDASSTSNGGSFTTAGGLAVELSAFIGGPLTITNATASTSPTTGAVKLVGGIAINNNTDASDTGNGGSFTTAGGVAVGLSAFIGGPLTVTDTTGGSFTTAGGAAVQLSLIVGGALVGNGGIFENRAIVTNSSATGLILTTGQILNAVLYRSGAGAAVTDTLPSAASVVGAIVGGTVGTTFQFVYYNTSTNAVTIAAGTGGTVRTGSSMSVAATNGFGIFLFVITSIASRTEAYDLFRVI